MGSRHDYAIYGMILAFSGSGVLDIDWWMNFIKNGDGLSFSQSRLVFLAKQCVPSPPDNIIVGFCSLEETFKT